MLFPSLLLNPKLRFRPQMRSKKRSKDEGSLLIVKLKMKGLLKKSKARKPLELVKHTRDLLIFFNGNMEVREQKRKDKTEELTKSMLEIRTLLYGDGESEPNKDTCAQLTQEFFKDDTFRLLIASLSKLNLGTRKNATHIVANLQRQQVQSRLIASEYLEKNIDLIDILIPGYGDGDIALSYGAILRECIRHQVVARYVLESDHMKKFFDYIQLPNFEIASDAAATFKELMTRHKSTVAQFLSNNYDWFFQEYNSQLLESQNYITKRQAIKLLGNMLLDRSNSAVMVRYVCSLDNMRILMNLLRDPNKTIQLETFHVFKLFVANENKPPQIVNVLVTNRSKLLRFFGNFTIEKEDQQFEADKVELMKEISILEPKDIKEFSSIVSFRENCEIPC
ncbi:putative MO25-like protein At5g47540 [Rosa rugosa]|uniref:putative MO25-like protein At5g47540 n=1 Tax=Rosa rugosa TaxID=74645 RepID=UPI002B40C49D|nr:putative MO25-like protein At5g47540 [Rosa rugosa]